MAKDKPISISSDDACIIYAILKSEVQRLRERHANRPCNWLAEVEGACDRLTIKLFGKQYLEREKAKSAQA